MKPNRRLRTPRPNAGVSSVYERKIRTISHQMGRDYLDEITRIYRDELLAAKEAPFRVGDGVISSSVQISARVLERLRSRWTALFDNESRGVASEFVRKVSGYEGHSFRRLLRNYQNVSRRSRRPEPIRRRDILPLPRLGVAPTEEEERGALEALQEHTATQALREIGSLNNGWVGWQNEGPLPQLPSMGTPESRDRIKTIEQAAVEQNVSLIKSIPQQFHDRVAQDVYAALRDGWPMDELVAKLRHNYGLTRNRARHIARDQNRAITARLNIAQALAAWGDDAIAIWRHVKGGEKHPRASHVAADGKVFKLSEGCWIDGEFISPGQKYGCQCEFEICPPGIN